MKKCVVRDCSKKAERRMISTEHASLCQMHHWRLRTHGAVNYWKPRLCSFSDCKNRHKAHGFCQFHYKRQKRGLPMSGALRTLHPKHYKVIRKPDHPLACRDGRVSAHRIVLYDEIGDRRVPCFWCGVPLTWDSGLCVDHIDHDRHNNHPTNLVPSCNSCNAGRMLINSNSSTRVSIYKKVA
jgi:hypothetical protein